MQPRRDIRKLGSKLHAVAQLSKINCRDVSSCENLLDVFRDWLAKRKIRFYLYALLVCFAIVSFFFFSFSEKEKEKLTIISVD